MSDDNALFALFGEGEPPITFEASGELYELRTVSHLNKMEEVKVRVLMRREEQFTKQLGDENLADARAEEINTKLIALRVELICMMTTMPEAVVEKLPTMQQQRLAAYIGLEKEDLLKLLASGTPGMPEEEKAEESATT